MSLQAEDALIPLKREINSDSCFQGFDNRVRHQTPLHAMLRMKILFLFLSKHFAHRFNDVTSNVPYFHTSITTTSCLAKKLHQMLSLFRMLAAADILIFREIWRHFL